jgi:steroid delta-isomerase-like uncharacterized protein
MSIEQNKQIARQMVEEVFNKGDLGAVDKFLAPNFIEREILPPGIPAGREGVKALSMALHTAFPDLKATVDDILAEGDKVVIRQTWSGTHKGDFMGVAPTGKKISIVVIDIVRVVDGKFVEHWGLMDSMGLMQQIGAVAA